MMDLSSREGKTSQDYASFRTQEVLRFTQFSYEPRADGEESGTCTPPLWKSAGRPTGAQPSHQHQSLSPASRTQAIAQGQRELMEMVRNMPEPYCELSLRDIVEKPAKSPDDSTFRERRDSDPKVEKALSSSKCRNKRQSSRKGYLDSKAQTMGSGSLDNGGFMLKMVFPASSLGSKSKRRNSSSSAADNISKVSPRTSLSDGSAKGLGKEWSKKFSASRNVKYRFPDVNPESVKSSSRSSSNSNNGENRRYVFFNIIYVLNY